MKRLSDDTYTYAPGERSKEILEGLAAIFFGTPLAIGAIVLLMMIVEDMRIAP